MTNDIKIVEKEIGIEWSDLTEEAQRGICEIAELPAEKFKEIYKLNDGVPVAAFSVFVEESENNVVRKAFLKYLEEQQGTEYIEDEGYDTMSLDNIILLEEDHFQDFCVDVVKSINTKYK
jgi:hypothetical protein